MVNPVDEGAGIVIGGAAKLATYWWVLIPIIVIISIAGGAFLVSQFKKKNSQWTHTLQVRRRLPDNRLTKPIVYRMRRFPLIKKAEVFELEKPVLGGYLMPELDNYSGENEFSIILDSNNRIYTNNGEFWNPDKSCVMVSAKHSEIDIQRQNLKADFQNINKINKRVEWATIAKYAFLIVALVVGMILGLKGIQEWGSNQQAQAQQAQAEAQAMSDLAKAMTTIEATVNTQQLEITGLLKELHETNNLQPLLRGNSSG